MRLGGPKHESVPTHRWVVTTRGTTWTETYVMNGLLAALSGSQRSGLVAMNFLSVAA